MITNWLSELPFGVCHSEAKPKNLAYVWQFGAQMLRSAQHDRREATIGQMYPGKGKEGFTLVEAMLAVVVLSVAAAGVLVPFVSGAAVRAEGARRTLAAGLASDLMEQIIKTPFDDIVTGYNYTEPQGQVKDATDAVFSDPRYANFSRTVTCEYVAVSPQPAPSDPAQCNFILVTVRVDYDGKETATIRRLVSE